MACLSQKRALKDISCFLDEFLMLDSAPSDSSNNGLQVEAGKEVSKIVLAVDASLDLFERASELGADLAVVHHGISWGPGFRRLTGLTAARLAVLFKNGISLYAAHLPLDAHHVIGHNAVMASKLGLAETAGFAEYDGVEIGVSGSLPETMSVGNFANLAESALGLKLAMFGDESRGIREVGIVSGGAGSDGIVAAAEKGVDCLVTGDVSHESWHIIRESGIVVASGGHYATETFGLRELERVLTDRFDVKCVFIDIPTGL